MWTCVPQDGYDSGSILLAMCRLNVPVLAYTLRALEQLDIVTERVRRCRTAEGAIGDIEGVIITPSTTAYSDEKAWVRKNVERFEYVYPVEIIDKETGELRASMTNHDDQAIVGLSLLLRDVKTRRGLVYMSGS